MEQLSAWQLVFCAVVVAVAFAVRGGAGFGGGAIAVPLLALVFPLPVTVPVVTVLNMLSSISQGVLDWRSIVWREILRILPGSLLGVFIGLYLLTLFDPQPLARALGAFVVLYAIYVMVFAARTPAIPGRWMLAVAAVTSLAAGIVGALFGGAAGPLYVIYLNAARLGKDAFRVTITTIMLFQGLTRIAGYATLGLYDGQTLKLLGVALPLMIIGSVLGVRAVRRFDAVVFNRAVGVVLLVSGGALLFK
ncbi:MAG: sulfite exporter TauE/SafE family protein [Burkholderiales bacterium]|nr:sulfite exporter TauE/SafE family protein [Burkholderiales bacterium]